MSPDAECPLYNDTTKTHGVHDDIDTQIYSTFSLPSSVSTFELLVHFWANTSQKQTRILNKTLKASFEKRPLFPIYVKDFWKITVMKRRQRQRRKG